MNLTPEIEAIEERMSAALASAEAAGVPLKELDGVLARAEANVWLMLESLQAMRANLQARMR